MSDFRLKVFESVASHLSFTKASGELFISQPAISKHIRELEAEFDVKLFHRKGNKVTLTQAGIILYSYTKNILSLHNELKFELSRLKGNTKGELRLGASTTIAQYVIPTALAKFHSRYPEISISLYNENTEVIEQKLLNNEIDIGLVEGKPTNSDIKYSPFINDELVIFTSAQHKKTNPLSLEEFLKLPLILRERGSGTLEIIEKTLQMNNISMKDLNILMYLGSTEAIKTYIKTGTGAGIVSRYALEQDIQGKTFHILEIPSMKFHRQFYFISPKGPDPSGSAKLFLYFASQYYNSRL